MSVHWRSWVTVIIIRGVPWANMKIPSTLSLSAVCQVFFLFIYFSFIINMLCRNKKNNDDVGVSIITIFHTPYSA